METDDKLNQTQAAKKMNVARTTLYNWAKAGKGPPCYVIGGSVVYYLREEVEDWIAANTVRVNPESQAAR